MENQKNNHLMTILAIVVIVLVVGYLIFSKTTKDDTQPTPPTSNTPTETPEVKQAVTKFKETLTTKHQYADGRHIYLGQFQVPNICYNYNTDLISFGNDKVIEIKYTQPEITDCPEKESVQRGFSVSFAGPQNQIVKATVNGQPVNLNIVEVPAGQDITK